MKESSNFICWDSCHCELDGVEAIDHHEAARAFALKHRTPAGCVIRVVSWEEIQHFEVTPCRVTGSHE